MTVSVKTAQKRGYPMWEDVVAHMSKCQGVSRCRGGCRCRWCKAKWAGEDWTNVPLPYAS